jgi:hypothetical protein
VGWLTFRVDWLLANFFCKVGHCWTEGIFTRGMYGKGKRVLLWFYFLLTVLAYSQFWKAASCYLTWMRQKLLC